MSYRFSNTDKWSDAWFSELKPNEKLLFLYLCDNCDIAGFIELTPKKWAFDIGLNTNDILGALKGLSRGLIYSKSNDCVYLRNFLKHQKNLPINEKNNAHLGIIKRFESYKIKFEIENIETFINQDIKPLLRGYGNGNDLGNDLSNCKYKNFLLSEIKISDVRESDLKYYEIAKNFYELFKSNLIELGSVTNQIEKTKATWIDDLRLIIEKDNYTIEDLRKVYNFLKTEKPNANGFSWKKNILSISKLREQMPKLLIESKNINSLPVAIEEIKKMHDLTTIDSEKRKCNQLAQALQNTKILKNKSLNFNIKYFIEQIYGMLNLEGGRFDKELEKWFLKHEENYSTKQILTMIKNYYV